MKAFLSATLLVAVSCAPKSPAFFCLTDSACGANSTCEANHFCAKSDATCASGKRYNGLASTLSSTCVGGSSDMGAGDMSAASDMGAQDMNVGVQDMLAVDMPGTGPVTPATGCTTTAVVSTFASAAESGYAWSPTRLTIDGRDLYVAHSDAASPVGVLKYSSLPNSTRALDLCLNSDANGGLAITKLGSTVVVAYQGYYTSNPIVGPNGNQLDVQTGGGGCPVGSTTAAYFVGNGVPGFADGTGVGPANVGLAQFNSIGGFARDGSGNLIVADANNNAIRYVSNVEAMPNPGTQFGRATVTTIVGNGSTGTADGVGAAARLNSPMDVAVSSNTGFVYIADSGNRCIRKMAQAHDDMGDAVWSVTTYAGTCGSAGSDVVKDGAPNVASFRSLQGLTVDQSENLYVTDANLIRKIDTNQYTITLSVAGANPYVDGAITAATFNGPVGIVADTLAASCTLYVGDTGNSALRRIEQPSPPDMSAPPDLSGADLARSTSCTSGARVTTEYRGQYATERGALDGAGHLYVTLTSYNSALEFNTSDFSAVLGGPSFETGGSGGITQITGGLGLIFADRPDQLEVVGGAYFGGTNEGYVDGSAYFNFNGGMGSIAEFNGIGGLTNHDGAVYVADTNNNAIRALVNFGNNFLDAQLITIGGAFPSATGTADGTAARFNAPSDVAADAAGNLFVADTGNHCIRKMSYASSTSSWNTTTLAGTCGVTTYGAADGNGAAASFSTPVGITVDPYENIYVTDRNRIRKIDANGLTTTLNADAPIAGGSTIVGASDSLNGAAFQQPTGIVADLNQAGCVLYVMDTQNNAVRKIVQ